MANAIYKLASPLHGLDTISSLSEMQEGFAITIDNYFCDNTCLSLRKGYRQFLKFNTSSPLKTLIPFVEKGQILATAGNQIFVSTKEEAIEDNIISDIMYWCYYNHRIFMCNGADNAKVWDGENLTDVNFTINGQEEADLKFASCGVANNQLLFWHDDNLGFYYAPNGNIAGELNFFDLSQIAKKGGYLQTVATWGKDSSQGYNKYIAFITSEGEIIVYQGNNFGDANNIYLVGLFFTGRPIGRNCVMNWGADLIIITDRGYLAMSDITKNGEIAKASNLFSDKISGYVIDKATLYSSQYGWKGVIVSSENFALFNVPLENSFEQHIMNLNTGAWCRFKDILAYDWLEWDNKLLFAGDLGTVYVYTGSSDNGEAIKGEIRNIYSKLGTDNQKLILLYGPRIETNSNLQVSYSLGIDYKAPDFEYAPISEDEGFYWASEDTAPEIGEFWNEGYWGGGLQNRNQWMSISGYCNTASLGIKTQTNNVNINIYETLFRYEIAQGAL